MRRPRVQPFQPFYFQTLVAILATGSWGERCHSHARAMTKHDIQNDLQINKHNLQVCLYISLSSILQNSLVIDLLCSTTLCSIKHRLITSRVLTYAFPSCPQPSGIVGYDIFFDLSAFPRIPLVEGFWSRGPYFFSL